MSYKLLKSSDYGVPQNRYRVIVVAFRKDLKISYEFPKPEHYDLNDLNVESIINVPDGVPNKNDIWELSPQSKDLVKYIPEGGSWKNVPYDKLPERLKKIRDNMKRYHSPNFYRRFARKEINGTITAAATPENSGILHPLENRRYSVREIARI
ncbi:DNA-cytosine methylase (Dcm) [Fructobacillus tropaeoli]|nr:DNA-cytosine methylase (Dcm) [Fructobacillus tropaeoli]